MDGERFDDLARGLAAARTRRRIIGGTLVLLGGLAVTGGDVALAGKQAQRRRRRKRSKRRRERLCRAICGQSCAACRESCARGCPGCPFCVYDVNGMETCSNGVDTLNCTTCEDNSTCGIAGCWAGQTDQATGQTRRFPGCKYRVGACAAVAFCAP